MPKLIVTCRELRYPRGLDGKPYRRGDTFEASDKDAKLLKAIKKADDAPPAAPVREVASVQSPTYAPKVLRVEDAEVEPSTESPPTAYARYRTRRLKAED